MAICLALVIATWVWGIRDGWAVLWFGLFMIAGFVAVALTFHLHRPKLPKFLERR
jgi:hypothetical protein